MSREDAAVARLVEEPGGAARRVHAMRREVHGLHDAADGALLDELAGVHRGAHFEALGIHDGELAPRFLHGLAHVGELLERGDAGLVGEIVLAGLHDADAERRAQIRNRRAGDELDRFVVEDFVFARELHAAVALAEVGDLRRIGGVERDERRRRRAARRAIMPKMCAWSRPMAANLMECVGLDLGRRGVRRIDGEGARGSGAKAAGAIAENMPASPAVCRKSRRSVAAHRSLPFV